jgi:hypothetical protein
MGRPRKLIEEKRLNVKLESEKHQRFSDACGYNGVSMTQAIESFIDRYLLLYGEKDDALKSKSGGL